MSFDWQIPQVITNADGEIQTTIEGRTGIWIPPRKSLQLIERRLIGPRSPKHTFIANNILLRTKHISVLPNPSRPAKCVQYRLPDQMETAFFSMDPNSGREREAIWDGDLLQKLLQAGWDKAKVRATLLNDFLNITNKSDEEAENYILQFASKWGPLWYCFEHWNCGWTPPLYENIDHPNCWWYPIEPIAVFQAKAIQAKAVFEIAQRLKQNKLAPDELWSAIGDFTSKDNIERQHRAFSRIFNKVFALANGPRLFVTWSERSNHNIKLSLDFGWGFLPVVWYQILQFIIDDKSKGTYRCSGCGTQYQRRKRRPQGATNYCDECGAKGNYKKSKSHHASKKRALAGRQ